MLGQNCAFSDIYLEGVLKFINVAEDRIRQSCMVIVRFSLTLDDFDRIVG